MFFWDSEVNMDHMTDAAVTEPDANIKNRYEIAEYQHQCDPYDEDSVLDFRFGKRSTKRFDHAISHVLKDQNDCVKEFSDWVHSSLPERGVTAMPYGCHGVSFLG